MREHTFKKLPIDYIYGITSGNIKKYFIKKHYYMMVLILLVLLYSALIPRMDHHQLQLDL